MKTEEIIELAKKAGWYISFAGNVFSPHIDADTPVTFEIERLLALHREALIESGELVPREQVDAAVKADEAIRDLIVAAENSVKFNDPRYKSDLITALAKIKEQP